MSAATAAVDGNPGSSCWTAGLVLVFVVMSSRLMRLPTSDWRPIVGNKKAALLSGRIKSLSVEYVATRYTHTTPAAEPWSWQ